METNYYIKVTKNYLRDLPCHQSALAIMQAGQHDSEEAVEDLKRLKYHVSRLELCIAQLDQEEREAVLLHYGNKLAYADVAEEMHWSLRTCKRRVRKAIESIAFMLYGDKSKDGYRFV